MKEDVKITKEELERMQRIVEWSFKTLPVMERAFEFFSRLDEKLGSHE